MEHMEIKDNEANANEFLPVKAESFWGKLKDFWLQEVEQDNFWFKPIESELLAKIKTFWLQEVEQDNFWFKPIKF